MTSYFFFFFLGLFYRFWWVVPRWEPTTRLVELAPDVVESNDIYLKQRSI